MRASSRTVPCRAEVTVRAPGFCTPRNDMHRCSASSTTPTPRGRSVRSSQRATCVVSRSWTCRPRACRSTTRASFDRPMIRSPGQVADVRDADERQQVVLAQRVERDRGRHHQLVVAAVVGEGRRRERHRRQQLGVHAGHPRGRLGHALGRRVDAQRVEQALGRRGGGAEVGAPVGNGRQRARGGRHERVGARRGSRLTPAGKRLPAADADRTRCTGSPKAGGRTGPRCFPGGAAACAPPGSTGRSRRRSPPTRATTCPRCWPWSTAAAPGPRGADPRAAGRGAARVSQAPSATARGEGLPAALRSDGAAARDRRARAARAAAEGRALRALAALRRARPRPGRGARRPRAAGRRRRVRRGARQARRLPRRQPLHHLGLQVRALRGRRAGAPARLAAPRGARRQRALARRRRRRRDRPASAAWTRPSCCARSGPGSSA